MNTKWELIEPNKPLAQSLSVEFKLSPLTTQVLINRGVTDTAKAEEFLRPRLAHLRNPMEIPNVEKAARRLLEVKARGEKVLIFGDYDVDGVTGTSILLQTLRFLGIDATYYIPHRYGEGYSLSIDAVKKIAESGIKLIITVDCGISSLEEVAEAGRLGLDVIITDHHNLPNQLPNAYAIVNPKMIPYDHPSEHLSGAGVAFKFAWALLKIAGEKDSVFLTSLLDLASLGTIADVVPLNRENRVLAAAGLNLINQRKRIGISELADAAKIGDRISIRNVNFGLAPRINAAGRLEHASKAVELMVTDDPVKARELAKELGQINTRRQGIGKDIQEEVFSRLDDNYIQQNRLAVLSGADWHPGVIGIVASKVVDRFSRPAVLIGVTDGVGRGSARSIDGINIFNILETCSDLFTDFGGHAGAAGFEIDADKIPELTKRLQAEAEKRISPEDLRSKIFIDAEVDLSTVTLNLVKELDVLDPHGEGNPVPIFSSRGIALSNMRTVGADGKHLKAKILGIDMIGFGFGNLGKALSYDKKYDIAYHLNANEWNGFEVAQLALVDIREAKR
ncbi:MAG: single-stranded-DNA-specific exonuclease RecJ [Candidatus Margulisiibacteriota bacterium]|nr:single-stranded-DNA-specific exonuclease RecJ [Candidatus Margulisiibacteriota bacterium]